MWRRQKIRSGLGDTPSGGRGKYGNERSLCSKNHSHRSKLERALCERLTLLEKAGEIEMLGVEDTVLLGGWFKYVADFKLRDVKTGQIYWAEAKGYETDRWPSVKKGWRFCGPGLLEIYKGNELSLKLVEVIIPRGYSNAESRCTCGANRES